MGMIHERSAQYGMASRWPLTLDASLFASITFHFQRNTILARATNIHISRCSVVSSMSDINLLGGVFEIAI